MQVHLLPDFSTSAICMGDFHIYQNDILTQ